VAGLILSFGLRFLFDIKINIDSDSDVFLLGPFKTFKFSLLQVLSAMVVALYIHFRPGFSESMSNTMSEVPHHHITIDKTMERTG
jgi:hypothetical protein